MFDVQSIIRQDGRWGQDRFSVTPEHLNFKLSKIITKERVEGKSVLDLGCSNGFMGAEALNLGASSYTGVDLNQGEIDKGKAFFGDAAKFYRSDLETFLENNVIAYDTVIMTGVLSLFLDPLQIMKMATEYCNEYFIVENIYIKPTGFSYGTTSWGNGPDTIYSSIGTDVCDTFVCSQGFECIHTEFYDISNGTDCMFKRYLKVCKRTDKKYTRSYQDKYRMKNGL